MFGLKRKSKTDEDDRPALCLYCENASRLRDSEMLCRLHGVVNEEHKCKKFAYDPLKRKPMRRRKPIPLDTIDLDKENDE